MLEMSFVLLYIVWNNDASEELVKALNYSLMP